MKNGYFIGGIALTLLVFLGSIAAYPLLGDEVPIHWNVRGEVDGYGSKQWAAFLGPLLMTGILVLFRVLPWLSPARYGVDGFRTTYLQIMLLVLGLVGYNHLLSLWAATGGTLDVSRALVGGVFLFLALVGNLLGRVERNFYIGIRTPWTIADRRVWYATHRLAAWTLVLAGVAGFVMVLWGGWFVPAFVVLGAALLVPVVFSLLYYKRLEKSSD